MVNKRKATLLTLILNIGFSIVTIMTGLIFTRFILSVYGSSVNGLISSINQFVSLFSIVEGGITTAAIVAIYKPFANNDYRSLNNILFTARKIYFRIGLLVAFSIMIFGSVYLSFIDSVYSYKVLFILLIFSMLQLVLSLIFESRYSVLLSGSNQEYKAIMIRTLSRLIGWMLSIYFIISHKHIVVVYSTYLVTTIINILILKVLVHRDIPQANYIGEYNPSLIKGSRDVLSQKIASVVFHSTDLVLISTMINLQMASVYAVYNMIYKAISTIVISISQAPANSFGHLASKDNDGTKLSEFFGIYETIIIVITSIFIGVTSIMIIPFVELYTSGIKDIVYADYYISFLFFTMFYLQMINKPYANIINVTGNFYLQNRPMLIASIINLVFSIFGAIKFGIYGILFGSIIGFLIIVVHNMICSYKYILKQKFLISIVRVGLNFVFCIIVMIIVIEIIPNIDNYFLLLIVAAIVFILMTVVIIVFNYVLWNSKMKGAFSFFKFSTKKLK